MAEECTHNVTESRRKTSTKVSLVSAGALVLVVLLLALLCHFVGIRSMRDIVAYRAMWRERYHPIWKDLALRRVKKGDGVEAVAQRHPPLYRNDAGPYTKLVYTQGGASPGLTVMAENGKLALAVAGAPTWRHVFFNAPGPMESYAQAQSEYRKRLRLDKDAYQIHRAIATGQDVFLSDHIEHRDLLDERKGEDEELYKLLAALVAHGGTGIELTVEAKKVFSGDLESGATLTFGKGTCDDADLAEAQTVFVSSEIRGKMRYTTVPHSALEWYQSLTPEQIQALVARRADK